MDYFGSPITRKIWGNPENILLIYVGSAADFALNPENHWLFFTMRLPSNPQKRFIETFSFNRRILMTPKEQVPELMMRIRNVHTGVEKSREIKEGVSQHISNKAYIEVGDMLIDYGVRGYEYLNHRKMSAEEKESYFSDMVAMFKLMRVEVADKSFVDFAKRRQNSLDNDLAVNGHTAELYAAYAKDLGAFQFWLLKQFQSYFIEPIAAQKLGLKRNPLFAPLYFVYPYIHTTRLFNLLLLFLAKPEVRRLLIAMED